jgi:hypothetical protein
MNSETRDREFSQGLLPIVPSLSTHAPLSIPNADAIGGDATPTTAVRRKLDILQAIYTCYYFQLNISVRKQL